MPALQALTRTLTPRTAPPIQPLFGASERARPDQTKSCRSGSPMHCTPIPPAPPSSRHYSPSSRHRSTERTPARYRPHGKPAPFLPSAERDPLLLRPGSTIRSVSVAVEGQPSPMMMPTPKPMKCSKGTNQGMPMSTPACEAATDGVPLSGRSAATTCVLGDDHCST